LLFSGHKKRNRKQDAENEVIHASRLQWFSVNTRIVPHNEIYAT
jgi:hypothetical protein